MLAVIASSDEHTVILGALVIVVGAIIVAGLGLMYKGFQAEVKRNGGDSDRLGDTVWRAEGYAKNALEKATETREEQKRVANELVLTNRELANTNGILTEHIRQDELVQETLIAALQMIGGRRKISPEAQALIEELASGDDEST